MEKVFLQIKESLNKRILADRLVALLLVGVICSTFIQFQIYDVSFTVYSLSLLVLCMTCIVCLLTVLFRKEVRLRFKWIDGLLIASFAYYIFRYDFDLQLANWRLILLGVVGVLWFLIRFLLESLLFSIKSFSWVLIITGCVQAVWGMLQLYGYCESNHNGFNITGSFLNPGPYSGYVAMVIPVAFYQFLTEIQMKRCIALLALAIMLCVLPAGMSRSAWLGAAVSSFLVLFWQRRWIKYWYSKKYLFSFCIIMGAIIVMIGGILAFNLKKDSAYGRLFIWGNTMKAIMKEPVLGHGSCMFPCAYAQEQYGKFQSGRYTDTEERIAGNPEYAFNEYLQLWIEGGCILLFLSLAFIVNAFKQGMKQKYYGLCGSLVSFLFFAFSSYPLQHPSFFVVAIVMIAAISSKMNTNNQAYGWGMPFLMSAIVVLLFYHQAPIEMTIEQWEKCRVLKQMEAVDIAEKGYRKLYCKLKHNADFIYEYGQILSKQHNFLESNELFRRFKWLRCNAQVHNALGVNYQNIKLYKQAENSYLYSLTLLPNRIYPSYLLAKLYALSDFRHPDNFRQMAETVLTKTPKVNSQAIEEMRHEVLVIAERNGLILSVR